MTDRDRADLPVEGIGGADDIVPPVPLGRPGRVLASLAGSMILMMMAVTTMDVVGRYFFGRPLFGAYEITEILMGLVIFAGMPLTTAAREHITVNFLEKTLSRRQRCLQAALGDLICAMVAAVMAWRVFARGTGLIEAHEVTLELGVGRGWIALAMACFLGLTAAAFVYAGIGAIRAARQSAR